MCGAGSTSIIKQMGGSSGNDMPSHVYVFGGQLGYYSIMLCFTGDKICLY